MSTRLLLLSGKLTQAAKPRAHSEFRARSEQQRPETLTSPRQGRYERGVSEGRRGPRQRTATGAHAGAGSGEARGRALSAVLLCCCRGPAVPGALQGAARRWSAAGAARGGPSGERQPRAGVAAAGQRTSKSAVSQSVCKPLSALPAAFALAFCGSNIQHLWQRGEKTHLKKKCKITWTNRALKKVLDLDPVTKRKMGTQTNPTCDKDKLFLLPL